MSDWCVVVCASDLAPTTLCRSLPGPRSQQSTRGPPRPARPLLSFLAVGPALAGDGAVALEALGRLLGQVGGRGRQDDGSGVAAGQGDGGLARAGDDVALVGAAHLDVDEVHAALDPLAHDLTGDDVRFADVVELAALAGLGAQPAALPPPVGEANGS